MFTLFLHSGLLPGVGQIFPFMTFTRYSARKGFGSWTGYRCRTSGNRLFRPQVISPRLLSPLFSSHLARFKCYQVPRSLNHEPKKARFKYDISRSRDDSRAKWPVTEQVSYFTSWVIEKELGKLRHNGLLKDVKIHTWQLRVKMWCMRGGHIGRQGCINNWVRVWTQRGASGTHKTFAATSQSRTTGIT